MFDCMFICLVNLPTAYVLANFTNVEIHYMYLICQMIDLIKCVIGFVLLKKKIWVNNIVGGEMDEE